MSVLCTGSLYPPPSHFCYRLLRPQGHSAPGRIMSMKNYSYTIWNRTLYHPDCSAMPQPTAQPRSSIRKEMQEICIKIRRHKTKFNFPSPVLINCIIYFHITLVRIRIFYCKVNDIFVRLQKTVFRVLTRCKVVC